ncbi:PREDICTED: ribosome-binding protein 1 isoform X2 [Nicrophorus vespilloides]|nr:PREDICTED: ribosome-binding protein 1 isoform X2 [Nicrophorus vespilloides]
MFDLESMCLIGGVFVISAGTLFIIDYLFKNKSYEEAVAEQRQQNSALYNSQRPKPKEKKQKKNNKKVKEKRSSKDKETDSVDDSENQTSDAGESSKSHHVEFTEVTVIEDVAKESCSAKRKQKKDVVRPILVNRDSSAENIQCNVEPVSPANHFEELHPKDEFELLNSHKDDSPKESPKGKGKKQNIENEPPKQQKSEMQKNKKSSKSQSNEGKKTVDVVDKPITPEPVFILPVEVTASATVSANPPPPKDKKKKKSEISTLQQLAGDKSQEVNISILMPLVRNAEMSRDEVQILIDMLLNKQQDAPVADEWSEGKADPIQKLKRQLAEKEKLVVELEESLTGSQNKLREIRADFNADRAILQQNVRDHLENINKCNAERQAIENKNQILSKQCKHFSDEHIKIMDQFNNLQLKHQQLEVHLAQKQETELNQLQLLEQKLKEDLAEREHKIADLLRINEELESNLHLEMQNKVKSRQIADEAMCMKQQLEVIHEQKEEEIKSYKSDIMHLKSEQVALSEVNNQLKNEIANLQTESAQFADRIDNVEKAKASLVEETSQWHDENAKLQEENAALSSEKATLQQEKSAEEEEKLKLAKEMDEIKGLKLKLETDISKLVEENKKLQSNIVVLIEDKEALEAKSTGTLETNEKQMVQLQAELTDANLNFQKMKEQLHKQLEEQRNKNNDLRQKNWKVMEALNAAESRSKAQEKQPIINLDLMITNARAEEQQAGKDFVQRLFPSIQVPSSLPHDKWEEQVVKSVEDQLQKLKAAAAVGKVDHSADLARMTSKISDYKKIIDETEGMLSKLHNHIETEEIRWRKELRSKDEQIERLEAEAQLSKQVESEMDVSLNKSIEVKKNVSTKSQNHSNPTNGPTPSAISHDLTLSTASSATSSITEESVKKNKKKKKKNNGK